MRFLFRPSTILILLIVLIVGCQIQAPAQSKSAKPVASSQPCGSLRDGVLKCPRFGFTYKAPFGWVDRTEEPDSDDSASSQPGNTNSAEPKTLLAIFERPPGALGETINSAVVIAAEPLANYHGVKQASDYFGPIGELEEQRGFKVENEPYAFPIGTKQLVRGDFSKQRGKLTMWQTSLVMIEKGYIVSFTFVGGGEDDVDELIERLSFGAANGHSTPPKPH